MSRREVNPEELQRLTDIFRQHGADDPESWARSQLEEGIPQLAIFCFAKALWEGIIDEDDSSWIGVDIEWAKSKPNAPCAQSGRALEEMLAKGVSKLAIIDLIRVYQFNALYHACSLLDGSRIVDLPVKDWTLHQVDERGEPLATIQGLHEVLLGLDPTGREMRPRTDA
jgi:hypothetical protein